MASGWVSVDAFVEGTGRDTAEVDSERYVSYSLDDLYPEWQAKAHCRGVGTAYYFGEDDDEMPTKIRQVRNASKLCDACPVFESCLRWAIEKREYYGVWAGTSGRTRRKIFKLVDDGEATVDDVVRSICNGQAARYRNSGTGRGANQSGDRLGDDASREALTRDLRSTRVPRRRGDQASDQEAAQG